MSVRTPPLPLATTLGRAMTAACAIEFDWTVRQRCVWEDLLLLLLLDFGSAAQFRVKDCCGHMAGGAAAAAHQQKAPEDVLHQHQVERDARAKTVLEPKRRRRVDWREERRRVAVLVEHLPRRGGKAL